MNRLPTTNEVGTFLGVVLSIASFCSFSCELDTSHQLDRARHLRIVDGKYHDAYDIVIEVIRDCPDDARAYYNKGLVEADIGENKKAIESYKASIGFLIKNKEGDYSVYNTLGWTLLSEGEVDKAIGFLELGAQNIKKLSNKSAGKLYNNLALAYAAKGQPDLAKANFNKANAYGNKNASKNLAFFSPK